MNIDVHCHFEQLPAELREKEIRRNIVAGVAVDYKSGEILLEYKKIYPFYNPANGIRMYAEINWNKYNKIDY